MPAIPRHTARLVLPLIASLLCACLATPAAMGSNESQSMKMNFGGRERSFKLYVPTGYDRKSPAPLVVALHGAFGTGGGMEDQTGFDRVADQHGFLVAYPDGIGRSWNAGKCCGTALKDNVDDVGFVRAMIAQIGREYAVDKTRVYGTGFSNGAFLLHTIACQAPDTFAAIAPVAGTIMTDNCNPKRPVPALLMLGRNDPRVRFEGGDFQGTYRLPFQSLVQLYGKRNGCSNAGDAQVSAKASGAVADCQTLSGCGNNEVSWCVVNGIGHQWAGGKTYLKMLLGANTDRFNDSEHIWQFFSRHHQ